jgi:hypothetical protein
MGAAVKGPDRLRKRDAGQQDLKFGDLIVPTESTADGRGGQPTAWPVPAAPNF